LYVDLTEGFGSGFGKGDEVKVRRVAMVSEVACRYKIRETLMYSEDGGAGYIPTA
jgi:hypothetical protein